MEDNDTIDVYQEQVCCHKKRILLNKINLFRLVVHVKNKKIPLDHHRRYYY
jgi:flagellar biogenesis protein FliO